MQRLMSDVLSVPEQISATAQLIPYAVALSYGDQQLKYGELDQRVDRFAAYIAQLGVGPGSTAAICMERSFDWIVAALGIMRAGAGYVPLDTAWPDSRLSFALDDSAATVLVARTGLLDRLDTKICGLDPRRDAELIAAAPAFVSVPVDLESLAYIIYTSGTTGTPKGVEITHANLIHLEQWHRKAFKITAADRASHLAGLGFDAAVWELWPNLCAGAAVFLAPDAVRSSPDLLQQWLTSERITVSFVPTIHAAAMMGMRWPDETALRYMLTGGDALHQGPALPMPFDVVNNYGPTECTVVATSSVLQPGASGTPAIGRPIAGANLYLLDERGEPVADGKIGEICIAGDGVGRGYRNLPESTARCFVRDPFSPGQGKRMYRTGDRGRRRPDGQIEFCGRSDRQVKIRGQRVELDEIGSAITRHPAIEFAAVSLKASEAGENQLVAYVLPKKAGHLPSGAELQKYLRRNLPDYMIPAVFMQLNSLPLSPSAKVDPALMEHPENTRPFEETAQSTAAALPIAQKLLTMFRGILRNPAITLDDDFFLSGGHSLLGMQLVTRLRTLFGVELTFQEIFDAPTVESLAPLVSDRLREHRLKLIWEDLLGKKDLALDDDFFEQGGNTRLLADLQQRIVAEFGRNVTFEPLFDQPTIRRQAELIQRAAKDTPGLPPGVFVLHPQGTRQNIFWLHTLPIPLAKELGDDQPFFFVTLTARDIALLGETPSMRDIAACLLDKIMTTQPRGPYILGGICAGSVLAYEVASQLLAAGEEVSVLLLLDSPTQPYLRSSKALSTRLKHPRYYLYRAARVGWRRSLANLCRRAIPYLPRSIRPRFLATESNVAHRVIENAAFVYQPVKYEGKVLLLLAKERDPLFDFLPGWKSVVPRDLSVFYVQGRHRYLIASNNLREIANLIQSTLKECSAGDSGSWRASA
jgi:amino acid adenylation domain-containing protein